MITIFYITGGTLIGFVIGLVGTLRGRVIATVVITRTRRVAVRALAATHLQLLEPHSGHHTARYVRTYTALADTQQWPVVSR